MLNRIEFDSFLLEFLMFVFFYDDLNWEKVCKKFCLVRQNEFVSSFSTSTFAVDWLFILLIVCKLFNTFCDMNWARAFQTEKVLIRRFLHFVERVLESLVGWMEVFSMEWLGNPQSSLETCGVPLKIANSNSSLVFPPQISKLS